MQMHSFTKSEPEELNDSDSQNQKQNASLLVSQKKPTPQTSTSKQICEKLPYAAQLKER